MSNLMHKVKDALTGHNEHKGSSHDSSDQNIEQNRGQYNSSAMGSEARDAYGTNPQDNSIHNPRMSTDNNKNAGRSATKNTDDYGSGGYSAGGFPDSKKSDLKDPLGSNTMGTTENQGSGRYQSGTNHNPSGMDTMRDTANTYGSSTTGTTGAMGSHDAGGGPNTGAYHDYTRDSSGFSSSDRPSRGYDSGMGTGNSKPDASTYNSSYAGGYGSSELNTGQMPVGASTSEYGASGMGDRTNDTNLGGSHGYNTRSNAGSNMANQMESRGESELNNRTDQQGFGGTAAAGGSSSNTQRRSSGPHSSNLLNKLDPRVRSSDYENQTAGGQQRGW